MTEPEKEIPYRSLRNLYHALGQEQKKKVDSFLNTFIDLMKGSSELAHFFEEIADTGIRRGILGINKREYGSVHGEREYSSNIEQKQEGGA